MLVSGPQNLEFRLSAAREDFAPGPHKSGIERRHRQEALFPPEQGHGCPLLALHVET